MVHLTGAERSEKGTLRIKEYLGFTSRERNNTIAEEVWKITVQFASGLGDNKVIKFLTSFVIWDFVKYLEIKAQMDSPSV